MSPINISTSPAIFRWKPAAWLRVSGDDAFSFLQGQFTNDLRPLERGTTQAVYGLWLTVKGKVLADSFVLREGGTGAWWVGSYFSSAAVIRERLENFVIADDVVVEDQTTAWEGVSVIGDGESGPQAALVGAMEFRGRRVSGGNREYVMPVGQWETARNAWTKAGEWDEATAETRRIADGIPAVPKDVGPADLPNEAGLERDAISYTKGCYLGQEVMARLKSMGQVRRRLVRVRIEGEALPAEPTALWLEGRQVGELRSVARVLGGPGSIGLAMVTRMHVAAGARLSLAVDGAPVVHVVEMS